MSSHSSVTVFFKLVIAPAEEKGTYYVNYKGFEHYYDNNTLLYKKFKNDIGKGYYLKLVGMPDINFRTEGHKALLAGSLFSYSNVYLDNDTVTKVIYSGLAGIVKINKINKIKEKYQARQFTVISKVAAKKRNKLSLQKTN